MASHCRRERAEKFLWNEFHGTAQCEAFALLLEKSRTDAKQRSNTRIRLTKQP